MEKLKTFIGFVFTIVIVLATCIGVVHFISNHLGAFIVLCILAWAWWLTNEYNKNN